MENHQASKDFSQLKYHLAQNNGIPDLETCAPDQVERARQLFLRDGFVVVRNVLTPEQLAFLRQGVDRVVNEMIALDSNLEGNRGSCWLAGLETPVSVSDYPNKDQNRQLDWRPPLVPGDIPDAANWLIS